MTVSHLWTVNWEMMESLRGHYWIVDNTNFVDVNLARKANLTEVERELPTQVTLAVEGQVATVHGAVVGTMILLVHWTGRRLS